MHTLPWVLAEFHEESYRSFRQASRCQDAQWPVFGCQAYWNWDRKSFIGAFVFAPGVIYGSLSLRAILGHSVRFCEQNSKQDRQRKPLFPIFLLQSLQVVLFDRCLAVASVLCCLHNSKFRTCGECVRNTTFAHSIGDWFNAEIAMHFAPKFGEFTVKDRHY